MEKSPALIIKILEISRLLVGIKSTQEIFEILIFIFLYKYFCEFLSYSNVFVLYARPKTNTKSFVDNTDVGPYRPPDTSPIQRR